MDHGQGFLGAYSGDDDLILSWPVVGTSDTGGSHVKSNKLAACNSMPRSGFDSHSALQSTWIQRLKPVLPLNQPEEMPIARKPPGKDAKVWTHFSKDFRSCRGSNTATHSRVTSWPLDGRFSEGLNFEKATGGPHAQDSRRAVQLPGSRGGDDDMMVEVNVHPPRGNPCKISVLGERKLLVPNVEPTHSDSLGARTEIVEGKSRIGRKSPTRTEVLVPRVQNPSQEKHPQTECKGGNSVLHSRVDVHFSSSMQEKQVVTGIKLTGLHTYKVAGAAKFAASQNTIGFGPLRTSIGKPSLPQPRSAISRAGFDHISDGFYQEGHIASKAQGGWPSPAPSISRMLDKRGASADADIVDSGLPVGIMGCEPIGGSQIEPSSLSSRVPARKVTVSSDLEAVTMRSGEGRDSLNKFCEFGGMHQYSDHSNNDVLIQSTNMTSTYVDEHAPQRSLMKDPHALDFICHNQVWQSNQTDTINNSRENIFSGIRRQPECIEGHGADLRAAGSSGVMCSLNQVQVSRRKRSEKAEFDWFPFQDPFYAVDVPGQTGFHEIQGTASGKIENTDSPSANEETRSAQQSSPQSSFIFPYIYERETAMDLNISKGKLLRGPCKDSNEGKAVQKKPFEKAKQRFESLQNTNFLDLAVENKQETMRFGVGDIALADNWSSSPQMALFEDLRQLSKTEEEGSSTASLPWEDLLEQYNQSGLRGNAKPLKSDLVDKLEKKASRSSLLYKKDPELKASPDLFDRLNPSCLEDDATSSIGDKDNYRSKHRFASTNNTAGMDLFTKQEKPMNVLEGQNQKFDDMDGFEEAKRDSQLGVCGRRHDCPVSSLSMCKVESRHCSHNPVSSATSLPVNTGKAFQNVVQTCAAPFSDSQKHLNSVSKKDKLSGASPVGFTVLKSAGLSRDLANVKEAVAETCFELDSQRNCFHSEKFNILRCGSEGKIFQSKINFTETGCRQDAIKCSVQKRNESPGERGVSTSRNAGHTRPGVLAESGPGCVLKAANAVEVSASQHGWLHRWQSPSSGVTSSKIPRSFIDFRERLRDKLVVRASTGSSSSALFINSAGRLEEPESNCIGKRLQGATVSGRGADERCIETTGLPDCSSEATTENLVGLSRSAVMWWDHHVRPSATAMAIVGTATREMQPSQTIRRGAVALWPSLESATPAFVVQNQNSAEFAKDLMETWEQRDDLQ